MAASSCVPMLFTPLEFENRMCTDGGVAHESPIDPWFADDDIDHIIIHRIDQPSRKPPLMPLSRLMSTIAATHASMNRQILNDRIELARLHGKKLTIITTNHSRPSPFFRDVSSSAMSWGMPLERSCSTGSCRTTSDHSVRNIASVSASCL